MSNLETMTALVVSTSHVTPEEADAFNKGESPVDTLPDPMRWQYGWLIYVGDYGQGAGCSDGLRGVIEVAKRERIQWVRFDEDGPALPAVPTYEW